MFKGKNFCPFPSESILTVIALVASVFVLIVAAALLTYASISTFALAGNPVKVDDVLPVPVIL